MNRRSFLTTLLGGAAAAVAAEAIPFGRVWFFPQTIKLANVARPVSRFEFADWITEQSLEVLKNKIHVGEFGRLQGFRFVESFNVGETIKVRLPQSYQTIEMIEDRARRVRL